MFTNSTLIQEAEVEDDEDDDDSMDNETTEADEQVIPKPCFVLLEWNNSDNINDGNFFLTFTFIYFPRQFNKHREN